MNTVLEKVKSREEINWENPDKKRFEECEGQLSFSAQEVREASDRLKRFAPVILHYFPETAERDGIIESPLKEIPNMRSYLTEKYALPENEKVFLKMDSHLPVSGSVKARGGIYEVLKHTEDLAIQEGILSSYEDDYRKLTTDNSRQFFASHKIQVGSTGNLGLSIGIMGAALGYQAIVHMSADAKSWKKDLLRKKGAKVIEYEGDYAAAVENGRKLSAQDPDSYFVDDENSKDLFLGYAVAGERLSVQLADIGVMVDAEHPLYVYIPCGVGGAPAGITFGLKLVFGDDVHVFFSEPTEAPCMLAGLASGLNSRISVQDYGLTGKTEADGLAVGRCSELAASAARYLIDGEATIKDENLYPFIQKLYELEKIFIEPSSGAAFQPFVKMNPADLKNSTHIIWATGGSFVPEGEIKKLLTVVN